MDSIRLPQQNSAFAALKRFARPGGPVERCELCSTALGEPHPHLLDPVSRKVTCSCEACAMLFSATGTKYRRIPRRIRYVPGFLMTDAQWDALMIPINLAFFFYSSPADRMIALYPSPAGPTESLLSLESWKEIACDNAVLDSMEPDVEALLVQRIRGSNGMGGAEHYIAPIDECFRLVGLIRARWRGLSGGSDVWDEIARFFADLKGHAHLVEDPTNA